jgi:hypothetical protein
LLAKNKYKSLWIPFGLAIIFCCANIGVGAYIMGTYPLKETQKSSDKYDWPPGMGGDQLLGQVNRK